MIVTSRPAFRSLSVSSDATCASYESMTTSSSSGSSKYGAKPRSPLSPATPPQTEQHLITSKGDAEQQGLEMDKEDNDAATVRSSSMRTYREGDQRGLTGFTSMTPMDWTKEGNLASQVGLVPGPMRVTLRDEGAVARDPIETGVEIQITGEGNASDAPNGSRYKEMLDANVTQEQVAIWLYGTADRAMRPQPAKPRQASASTSRFSRPFLKIATALSASGSVKSPASGPNSAASGPSNRLVLGPLPGGTSMKTSRSRSSNADSNNSPTGSTGWRRSFLGSRPTKTQRPKSMQVPSNIRIGKDGPKRYDDQDKRWLPATRETARRFSMSGESDDNNLSDVAPSCASSMESGKNGRRRPSSMLGRVSSAHQSFTSAASSVFLPTPKEEREAFDFLSGLAPSSSIATDIHPRSSSISKDASNGRFAKMLRRISGQGWREDTSRGAALEQGSNGRPPKQRPLSTADMPRFPTSFSSFGSTTGDIKHLSVTTPAGQFQLQSPVMPGSRHSSKSLDTRTLNSVDEETSPPVSEDMPGDLGMERPAIQDRSSSLQTVV